jgi:hypothetical protein
MTSRLASGAALVLCAAACDPLLNVAGSFFPAWMVATVVGVAARLEPHLGPTVLI